ncbi:MAG: APC family permease [Chloroflexi bacterium]|nr:APC family permease [Chloroflexota bacterium]
MRGWFGSYVTDEEARLARRALPRLLFEGLLLGGTGLGVFALIFEIAADAFSVAAYQTLLAIHGAHGYHLIAIAAFIVLSAMLYYGIVPAYQAGSYLRPSAGGSGPLVESIAPARLRWLSWVGTSLFFLDAILTIIISAISAADVLMLVLPELAAYRILLAEAFALFIMAVLVLMGPRRAVPLFLIGGGAFTIFTLFALGLTALAAGLHPEWAFLTDGIIRRLRTARVVEHVVQAAGPVTALSLGTIAFLFFRSMSSAMLGFSGYEVIPASGKHAARPKWVVIRTALTLAALFLIGTGMMQLWAAKRWNIPATEGYSTLLIEYEIVAVQWMGRGVDPEAIQVTPEDVETARRLYEEEYLAAALLPYEGLAPERMDKETFVQETAYNLAMARAINEALRGTPGAAFLVVAGLLLAIILLLAQGGGYVGGAAVAANAARLGRLPAVFLDDRVGIVAIWGVAAVLIPIIRQVTVVEAYYAFGFVSAFVISSTAVYFVRDDVLQEKGIDPRGPRARALRFAGLRGMIASYTMLVILVIMKYHALPAILLAGAALIAWQWYTANGGWRRQDARTLLERVLSAQGNLSPSCGLERALEDARQRGIAQALEDLIEHGALLKFNVENDRFRRLIAYEFRVNPRYFRFQIWPEGSKPSGWAHEDEEHSDEPSLLLQEAYQRAYEQKPLLLKRIEYYSHAGIFAFIQNYCINWIDTARGRPAAIVQQAMLKVLFPGTPFPQIWEEFRAYQHRSYPEPIWQFGRQRYRWAKDQWPNLSDRITTVWTLQDFGKMPRDLVLDVPVRTRDGTQRTVHIYTNVAALPEDARDPFVQAAHAEVQA